MRTIHPQTSWRKVAVVLGIVTTGNLAYAQRGERIREVDLLIQQPGFLISSEQLVQSVFGQPGAVERTRDRLESVLRSRVEKLDRLYRLSDAQKKKLVVAGRGDITHFFDRLEEIRRKLPLLTKEEEIDKELREIEAYRVSLSQDLFGEGSILAKTLKKTLTHDQSVEYEKATREATLHRHRAMLQWVLGTLDQSLALTPLQHGRLEELLSAETRPPQRFGAEDYYGVMFQLSLVATDKLKPIFDIGQWAKLSLQLEEAKRKEQMLKEEGYLPADELAGTMPRADKPGSKPEKKRG